MERQDIDIDGLDTGVGLVERHPCRVGATLRRLALARMVDENAAHDLGCESEKMRPILPPDLAIAEQADEGFVRQRGGLEGVIGALVPELMAREAAKLAVDNGNEVFEGLVASAFPGMKKLGNPVPSRTLRRLWSRGGSLSAGGVQLIAQHRDLSR